MCSVLDLDSEGDIRRLRDYDNYYRLDDEDKKALMALCLTLDPVGLNGETASQCQIMPQFNFPGLQDPESGAYIHMSNRREFDCSRVIQFEALNEKLNQKASLSTGTDYR